MLFPSISVVIPVHAGGESFRQFLASLVITMPPPHEIIVVVDGNKDSPWGLAKEWGVKVLRLPTCEGPAHALNWGARVANGEILFFVDADVAIYPDTVEQVATIFKAHTRLAALFGSYDDAPGASKFLSQYKNLFHHYTHKTACEEASTFWGACGAIRREIFLSLGGFDEGYRRPCVEDIELGYRLKAAGYSIWLCKALQVKHLKQWRPISLLKAEFFDRALPWTELILRDRALTNDLNLGWSSRVSAILIYGLAIALIGAYWWWGGLTVAAVILLSLLALNAPVYRFFWHKRGLLFALKTIPWHWFYYFYSSLAFAIGIVRYWWRRRHPAVENPTIFPQQAPKRLRGSSLIRNPPPRILS